MRKARVMLNAAQREEATKRFENGERAASLADEFNVTRDTIYKIVRNNVKSQNTAAHESV